MSPGRNTRSRRALRLPVRPVDPSGSNHPPGGWESLRTAHSDPVSTVRGQNRNDDGVHFPTGDSSNGRFYAQEGGR